MYNVSIALYQVPFSDSIQMSLCNAIGSLCDEVFHKFEKGSNSSRNYVYFKDKFLVLMLWFIILNVYQSIMSILNRFFFSGALLFEFLFISFNDQTQGLCSC